MKEHVRLTGARAPSCSSDLTLPQDNTKLADLSPCLRDAVLRHIAGKNMDCVYLPELWFSDSRKRLLIQTEQGWMGRDVTGASPQKWITYNRQTFLQQHSKVQTLAIVVEDTFSYYKVRWAMRNCPNVGVFCALGTTLSNGLLLELLKYESTLMFLDGDKAGWRGANEGAQRIRAFGKKTRVACAPLDKDPKDMTIQEIGEHVWNGTNVTQGMT
jgi:hypothetical protein